MFIATFSLDSNSCLLRLMFEIKDKFFNLSCLLAYEFDVWSIKIIFLNKLYEDVCIELEYYLMFFFIFLSCVTKLATSQSDPLVTTSSHTRPSSELGAGSRAAFLKS